MHDGSVVVLKKLSREHDPKDRTAAMRLLEESNAQQVLLTGLIFIDTGQLALGEIYNLPDTPLNRLPEDRIRSSPETLQKVNDLMF